MITKKMFCEITIREFLDKLEKNPFDNWRDITEGYAYQSTSVGLAMKYLGLIKSGQTLDYLASRAGIYKMYIDKEKAETNILTFREILDMLPEEL